MSLTATFVAKALLSDPGNGDATDAATIDATVRCIARYGLERLSIDDVAEDAGVGRATVFRRFGSKEELLRRTIAREGAAILEGLLASVAAIEDPTERFVEFTVAAARLGREHPVAARLVADGSMSRLLQDPQLVGLIRSAGEAQIASAWPSVDVEGVAEVFLRFFASLCVLPDLGMRIDDDETIRRLARVLLAPLESRAKGARRSRTRRKATR